jgi:hypothetical protein
MYGYSTAVAKEFISQLMKGLFLAACLESFFFSCWCGYILQVEGVYYFQLLNIYFLAAAIAYFSAAA